jgi:hypothetical protein
MLIRVYGILAPLIEHRTQLPRTGEVCSDTLLQACMEIPFPFAHQSGIVLVRQPEGSGFASHLDVFLRYTSALVMLYFKEH